ncbi:unnamed protein product [Periconia digitata]|uniref:Rad21/Rec8-like protein N-terminal domain-containing protein n=1 Tax=Periconia digitata TaxID=1303443 RepID=A0A9W4UPM4_9PLEO|nr:unnamed protein product [Periconia digitata]
MHLPLLSFALYDTASCFIATKVCQPHFESLRHWLTVSVLTSRKYGIATVWLVATLGAKSNSKKVNRKAIQDVDLPKACETIKNPAAPMALRLQSNLLYGVMRVWSQQSEYVLSDFESFHNAMYMMLRSMHNDSLDPNAGKAKPEQLILQDDPSFLPEFAAPPAELLAQLNIGLPIDPPFHVGDSQSLTPFGSQQDPSTPEPPIGGLILPPSSSNGAFDGPGVVGFSSVGRASGGLPDNEGFDDAISDPGFTFDEDGNLIDLIDPASHVNVAAQGDVREATMQSDGRASSRVRQEHEEGLHTGAEQLDDQMDLDFPILDDELPDAEPFASTAQQSLHHPSEAIESSPTVVATVRRKKRTAQVLPVDTNNELRSKDLMDWNTNYVANMQAASQAKNQKLLAKQAKKNAEYWVWGAGIGGIGARLQGTAGPTPFDMFMGDKLFEHFTGLSRHVSRGTKRDRDSGIDDVTQEESRRVRRKSDEFSEHMGRAVEDEAMFIPGGDDVELPREASAALDENQLSSAMPWNISASLRGSSAVPRSARALLTGSMGATSSLTAARRAARLVSASPLHGRGQNNDMQNLMQGFDEGINSFDDYAGFEGPGFSSDMPVAATAPADREEEEEEGGVREVLGVEGEHFIDFVADAIDEKRRGREQGADKQMPGVENSHSVNDDDSEEVLFEELIPPQRNNKVVASQALMMALTLGSKGLLHVRQDEEYEEIGLSLTDKAKAPLLAVPVRADDIQARQDQVQDNDNVGGEDEGSVAADDANAAAEEENVDGGQFEEQFEAGRGDNLQGVTGDD